MPDRSRPVCSGETLAFVKASLHKLLLKNDSGTNPSKVDRIVIRINKTNSIFQMFPGGKTPKLNHSFEMLFIFNRTVIRHKLLMYFLSTPCQVLVT